MNRNKTGRLMLSASLFAMSMAAAPSIASAQAQTTTPTTSESTAVSDVIIVGARAAERSAIDRKKRSATAIDVIVADDVGQFPDKNAAEAIARIAGVALDVSDSGEGHGFTIRGQSADLIRVEVDGMSVLGAQASGHIDAGSREGQLNELSSELIKSVEVVKGQTADMTPGGVGGTVRIEQRNGLDFKKPLYRLNLQVQGTNMHDSWTPRINAIIGRQFFDGRLGYMLNLTYSKAAPSQDFMRISGGGGWWAAGDFDNSADKTFVTPYDAAAAAVTTKAGCAALPTTGTNPRGTCYAQWEDYVPQRIRYGRGIREDVTTSAQFRVDFKVSDNLTLFASANPNVRKFFSKDHNLNFEAPFTHSTELTGASIGLRNDRVNNATGANRNDRNILSATTSPTHHVTSYVQERWDGTAATRPRYYIHPDATGFDYYPQIRDLYRNQSQMYYQTGADFFLGNWSGKARAQLSKASVDRADRVTEVRLPLQRIEYTLLEDSGAWNYEASAVAGTGDLYDPATYLPRTYAPTTGVGNQTINYYYGPNSATKRSETNFQLDMTRDLEIWGPLKRIKFGVQKRDLKSDNWSPNFGTNISPTVRLLEHRSDGTIRACAPVAAATSCTLGTTYRDRNAQGFLTSTDRDYNLTPTQFEELTRAMIQPLPGARFMAGVVDDDLIGGWATLDTSQIDGLLKAYGQDTRFFNQLCMFHCLATDGNWYDRPSVGTDEGTTSAYVMADAEFKVFGMDANLNMGVRYQEIDATGLSIVQVFDRAYQPVTTGTGATAVTRLTAVDTLVGEQVNSFNGQSDDLLPSANLTLWPIEDKVAVRYTIAKQRARPNLQQLGGSTSINCYNLDESQRDELEGLLDNDPTLLPDDGDPETDEEQGFFENTFRDRCTGRFGNPQLAGYSAVTQNASLEWYPNRDTNVSVTWFQISVDTGRPTNLNGVENFIVNGNPFYVDTYQDSEGGLKTTGLEVQARTAFTWAPWFLRHTGAGFNTSTTRSSGRLTRIHRLSGEEVPQPRESSYYYNVNVWYDDGRINARLAYQTRDEQYVGDGPTGTHRIPRPECDPLVDGGFGGSCQTSDFGTWAPTFRSRSQNLDAQFTYTLNEKVAFYIEGKNLLDDVVETFTPQKYRDSGVASPAMRDIQYYGRKYYAGIKLSF